MKKRIFSLLTCLALVLGLLPAMELSALAATGTTYYYYDTDSKALKAWEGEVSPLPTENLSGTDMNKLGNGTYLVSGSLNLSGYTFTFDTTGGTPTLLLLDSASVTVRGINLQNSNALRIYGVTTNSGASEPASVGGTLILDNATDSDIPALGGGTNTSITIHGGTVTATSSVSAAISATTITVKNGIVTANANAAQHSAISGDTVTIEGGTVTANAKGGDSVAVAAIYGNVTISDGTVTATVTATNNAEGAAIGPNVTISGGTVTATVTGGSGAAIGDPGTNETGNGVTISGGDVTATTNGGGAAIGAGAGWNDINITIEGGTVTAATSGSGAAIGGGAGATDYANYLNVTITGGTVTAENTAASNGGAAIGTGYGNQDGSNEPTISINQTADSTAIVNASTTSGGVAIGRVTDNTNTTVDLTGTPVGGIVTTTTASGSQTKVGGDVELTTDLTIPAGTTMVIPEDKTLTVPEGKKIVNNGTLIIYSTDSISVTDAASQLTKSEGAAYYIVPELPGVPLTIGGKTYTEAKFPYRQDENYATYDYGTAITEQVEEPSGDSITPPTGFEALTTGWEPSIVDANGGTVAEFNAGSYNLRWTHETTGVTVDKLFTITPVTVNASALEVEESNFPSDNRTWNYSTEDGLRAEWVYGGDTYVEFSAYAGVTFTYEDETTGLKYGITAGGTDSNASHHMAAQAGWNWVPHVGTGYKVSSSEKGGIYTTTLADNPSATAGDSLVITGIIPVTMTIQRATAQLQISEGTSTSGRFPGPLSIGVENEDGDRIEGCTWTVATTEGTPTTDYGIVEEYGSGTYDFYPSKVGSVKITFSHAGDNNYDYQPVTTTLTINKGTMATQTASGGAKFGKTGYVDLTDYIVEGGTVTVSTITSGAVLAEDENGVKIVAFDSATKRLNFEFAENATVGGATTVTLKVASSTYLDYNISVRLEVLSKEAQHPTFTTHPTVTRTYGTGTFTNTLSGAQTSVIYSITGNTYMHDGETVTFAEVDPSTGEVTILGADDDTSTPVTITATAAENDEYAAATASYELVIEPATLTIKAKDMTVVKGTNPAQIVYDYTATGFVNGDDEGIIVSGPLMIGAIGYEGEVGQYSIQPDYVSLAVPAINNYEQKLVSGTLTVKDTVILTLTPSKTSLSGGGTVTLTVGGFPSEGKVNVTCDNGITPSGSGANWTADLPNETATYIFTASYEGSDTYMPATIRQTVKVTAVEDDTPAPDDGTTDDGGGNGGSGGSSSSSSSGGGSSSSSVTVPISGDDNTIHVGASVKGDTATISKVDLSKLETVIGDDVQTGVVTIDFSGLKTSKPITTVELPSNVVKEIAEAVSNPNNDAQSLEIILSDGTSIEFDAVALGEKSAQAGGLDITISIKASKGTSAQSAVVGDRPAYDINVTSGGKHISDMGGMVTVHAPYELKDGELPRGIIVYHVDDNGNKEACVTSYDSVKKRVNWQTDHLSLYMIDYDPVLAETCDGVTNCPSAKFIDIDPNAWYHEAIDYILENGLMNGYGNGHFGPNDKLSRGMLAQILYNLEGRPVVAGDMPFTDVAEGRYYVDAIKWVAQNGIVGGYGGGLFGPDDPITREQLAVMLWRYAGSPAATNEELNFSDADEAGTWAVDALIWAQENGVMQGNNNAVDPKGNATRAHVAQMLKNFIENIIK